MNTPEERAKRIFGERAARYTTSACHTDPQVLDRVVALARPHLTWTALDIATGTGHTAFALAPHVAAVIGLDLTPEMLAEAEALGATRSIANVTFRAGDAHELPFADASFDLVTCRRAAHHFSDIGRALREMKRVLRPGGRMVIDDRSVPEDDWVDGFMNEIERYHDESHVWEYRPSVWRRMLEELGVAVDAVETYVKHRPLSSLTDGVAPETVRTLHDRLADLGERQRAALNLVEVNGELHSNHWYVLLAATNA